MSAQDDNTTTIPLYAEGSIVARRYRIITMLGKGATGSVYLCCELKNPDNLKAIKILSPKLLDDNEFLNRFYREGKIASQIQSPHVVKSYDMVMDDGLFAYTMELVPGGSLADLLQAIERPDLTFVQSALGDMSQGLAEIHRLKVIHRDLKPSNVLITEDEHCKITDFGVMHLAKELRAEQAGQPLRESLASFSNRSMGGKRERLTSVNDFIGTVDYLTPEYINAGVLDERSDIYALGVIGYQMLAGRVPFEGETISERLNARLNAEAPELSIFRSDIPKPLHHLIMRCVERNPANRPQSALEFLDALQSNP